MFINTVELRAACNKALEPIEASGGFFNWLPKHKENFRDFNEQCKPEVVLELLDRIKLLNRRITALREKANEQH